MPTHRTLLPFLSQYPASIDDKGRLSVPADYRHALPKESDGTIILTLGNLQYLNAFPLDFFNAIWNKADADGTEFASLNSLERDTLLLGEAVHRTLDTQGRITVPQRLLEQANIGREIVFMGRRTHFTIWDAKAFEEHRKQLSITPGDAWQRLIDQGHKMDKS
jgi:MraZ protein